MNMNIQAINFEASEKLQEYINKKGSKLLKFSDDIQNIDVYLKVVKPESAQNKEVEIKIYVPNADFFASKTCDTFEEAFQQAAEALEKQIKKHKEKNYSK